MGGEGSVRELWLCRAGRLCCSARWSRRMVSSDCLVMRSVPSQMAVIAAWRMSLVRLPMRSAVPWLR